MSRYTQRIRQTLAMILILCSLISVWGIFLMFQVYSNIASTEIHDHDLKWIIQSNMATAQTNTAIVAVLSFCLGICVVFIYGTLKRTRALKSGEIADSEKLNYRVFYFHGAASALITAAFGAICCYVGYYTINDALDFRALELGKGVLGYAAVNLAYWIFALYHSGRGKRQTRSA